MASATFKVAAVVPVERTFRAITAPDVTLKGLGVRAVPVEDARWADLEGWYADAANGQVGVTVFEHLDEWKEGFVFDAILQPGDGPPGATYTVARLAKVARAVLPHGWLAGRSVDGLKVLGVPVFVPPDLAATGFYSNGPGGAAGFTVYGLASAYFRQGLRFHFLVTPRRPAPAG